MTYDPRFSWNNEGSPGELQGEQRSTRRRKGDDQEPRRRLIPAAITVIGLLLFAGIVWYAYSWGRSDGASEAIPVVQAPDEPEKERPENPGGLEVPYQDTLVLNPGNGQGEEQDAERLLPPPEEPVEREQTDSEPEGQELETAEQDTTPEEESSDSESARVTDSDEDSEASVEEVEQVEAPQDEEGSQVEEGESNESPEAQEETSDSEGSEDESDSETGETAPEDDTGEETTDSSDTVAEAYRIQLAAVRSTEAAEAEWQRLQAKHEDLLGELSLNIERAELGEQGVYYRIQAGPLPDKQAADSLCEDLKSNDQACLVRNPQ